MNHCKENLTCRKISKTSAEAYMLNVICLLLWWRSSDVAPSSISYPLFSVKDSVEYIFTGVIREWCISISSSCFYTTKKSSQFYWKRKISPKMIWEKTTNNELDGRVWQRLLHIRVKHRKTGLSWLAWTFYIIKLRVSTVEKRCNLFIRGWLFQRYQSSINLNNTTD